MNQDLIKDLKIAIEKSRDTNGDMFYLGAPDPLLVRSLEAIELLEKRIELLNDTLIYIMETSDCWHSVNKAEQARLDDFKIKSGLPQKVG